MWRESKNAVWKYQKVQYFQRKNSRDLDLLINKNMLSNAVIRVPLDARRSEFIVVVKIKTEKS